MMKQFYKSTFVACLAFISITASAAQVVRTTPQQGSVFLGGVYSYFMPNNDDLDYAVVNSRQIHEIKSINPGFHSAFELLLGYLFADQKDFLQANWQHFNANDDAHIQASPGETIAPPFEVSSPLPAIASRGEVKFNENAIDLMYGHMFKPWSRVSVQLLGGLRYFELSRKLFYRYYTANNTLIGVNPESRFDGIGPRFAAALMVHINHGFSFIGAVGTSLLVGTSTTEDTHTNSAVGEVLRLQKNSIDRVVPELDGKLGVRYTYYLHQKLKNPLIIEVGYQATDYINALDRLNPVFDNSFNLLQTERTRSSFMLSGPYLRFVIYV